MSKGSEVTRGQTVVIKAGGQVGDRAAAAVVDAVATLRGAGARVVVVHGGGPQISEWLERCHIPVRFHGGRRITDAAALEVVEMVLSARVNKAWVAALSAAGLEATGVSGRDAGLVTAEPRSEDGIPLGRVGRVTAVNPRILQVLLAAGITPVVSPVSQDACGEAINVNADEVAAAVAKALRADVLLLLTDVPGVLSDPSKPNSVIPWLDASSVEELLAGPAIAGGMRPKLEAALEAARGGVGRVHLLDGTDPATVTLATARLAAGDPGAGFPGTTVVAGPPADAPSGAEHLGAARVGAPISGGAGEGAAWIQRGQAVLMNNYGRLPLVLTRGRGARVYDADGREYLDFVSGLAVTSLGHGNEGLADALARQARELIHCSNLYWIPTQIQLAERLAELSGMERWFFANSGTEVNEAAIKLARRYGIEHRGPQAYEIIATTNSFHGRTFGSLAATGQTRYQQGFGPLPEGFRHVPFGDLDAVAAAISDRTCAVLVEPIQGEGGVHVPPDGYLRGLRALCDQHGILLILDEVQTGIGRTGRWFAYQHEGILPDVVTLAKALANGVPIGAMGARGVAATVLTPGTHASTFGGNPLAAAAALYTLNTLEKEGLVERAAALGRRALEALGRAAARLDAIEAVRGRGLMLGVQLRSGAGEVAQLCRERGLLVNAIGDRVVRLLPPLTLSDEELDSGLAILVSAIEQV